MARYLMIVSREHAWLHASLTERFADDPNVHVVVDRRQCDRRCAPAGFAGGDRRRADRRTNIEPQEELLLRSHTIVRMR
jgi:hypothetical protein